MSKERLEEIKGRVLKNKVYIKCKKTGETRWGHSYELLDKDYEWLIQQAERAQEYDRELISLEDNKHYVSEMLAKNKRYREALVFYADRDNYREQELKGIVPPRPITFKPILHDYGSIARQALEDEEWKS